jgi:hypothetical protein
MIIKNKPRNASRRASRFFMPSVGDPTDRALVQLFTAKLHDNGIFVESTPFDFGHWTIFVVVTAFLTRWETGLTEGLGLGSYLPTTGKNLNPQLI